MVLLRRRDHNHLYYAKRIKAFLDIREQKSNNLEKINIEKKSMDVENTC